MEQMETSTPARVDPAMLRLDGIADKSLLIVDDDKAFCQRLARAMESRGFEVISACTVAEGLSAIAQSAPAFAVIDMRLTDGNGLDVISDLKARRPDARAVILTGYGNIVTAVTAVKLGAFDYLAKPADADEIHNALMASSDGKVALPEKPDVRRPGALGAYPAHLRIVRAQRLRDGAPAGDAPAHAAAHPGQACAALRRATAEG